VRFFLVDAHKNLSAIYMATSDLLARLTLCLNKFFLIPISDMESIHLNESDSANLDDAMDIDEPEPVIESINVQPQEEHIDNDDTLISEPNFAWIYTQPFCPEVLDMQSSLMAIFPTIDPTHLLTPLLMYLQFMKEAVCHLAFSGDVYEHALSNFHELYSKSFGGWFYTKRRGSRLGMDITNDYTIESTNANTQLPFCVVRQLFLASGAHLMSDETCDRYLKAELGLCVYEMFIHVVSRQELIRDPVLINDRFIHPAISEFASAMQEFPKHSTSHEIALEHRWWFLITPENCIVQNDDGFIYMIPIQLSLVLRHLRGSHWSCLPLERCNPDVRIRNGKAMVSTETMLLYVLPFLRRTLTEETIAAYRARFAETHGGIHFASEHQFNMTAGLPSRIAEASARIRDKCAEHDALVHVQIPDDFDIIIEDGNLTLPSGVPRMDFGELALQDVMLECISFFTMGGPRTRGLSQSKWRMRDISRYSPTISNTGFKALHFDRRLIRSATRLTADLETRNVSGWKKGEVATIIPDIEDFASDGGHVNLLPPCIKKLAELAPPKKRQGNSKLRNYQRMTTASLFLHMGYEKEDVVRYMSDGSNIRTTEATGVVSNHYMNHFEQGDVTERSFPYSCGRLIENAKSMYIGEVNANDTVACPYATSAPSMQRDSVLAMCACDNYPGYDKSTNLTPSFHPLYLLWKRVKHHNVEIKMEDAK
jgi:hypothetical protein